MDRTVLVFVRDSQNRPLPGARIEMEVDGVPFGGVDASEGRGAITIPGPHKSLRIDAHYPGQKSQSATLGKDQDDWTFHFSVVGGYSNMTRHIFVAAAALAVVLTIIGVAFYAGLAAGVLPLAVGVVLILIALALAFAFRDPTLLQAQLIRSTFSLAAGGIASQIPGWIDVTVTLGEKTLVAAGGAIAVYVISFFFVPARDK